jgi:hypothetical protein
MGDELTRWSSVILHSLQGERLGRGGFFYGLPYNRFFSKRVFIYIHAPKSEG